MSLNNLEFVLRHQEKNTLPATMAKPMRKNPYSLIISVIIALFLGVMGYILLHEDLTEDTRLFALLAIGLSAFLGFLALRAYTLYKRRQENYRLLREVMEGSRGARLITDGADNTVYCNQNFARLCKGAGEPSLQTLALLFADNEEARNHFRLLADQAHRGLTNAVELFTRADENERWLMVTAQPVSGFAGYVHWRVDDVTKQFTVDRAIREEREKLIDFTDNAPVGFFSVDESGRFVFANAAFARWLGEDLRSLLDHGYLHTYLLEPPSNARPYDLISGGKSRQVVEVRMKGAAGRSFLASINQAVVQEDGGRVRTRAVVHDLTNEREMRKALKASEDRFLRFFEEAPLGIILLNSEGIIDDCNTAFAQMIGTTISEIENTRFTDLIRSEDRESYLSAVSRIEQGQQMQAPLEITLSILRKRGDTQSPPRLIQTQLHARRFREGGNLALHFIDITEQKSLEAQFVQSQKMQAIGQLAGGIAHDFNNLLTAIIGFCDLLLLRHKPGDPSFADIMQIKQNSNRAANLVRQLLAFSRQQTLRPRILDITDTLTELSHLLRRLIGAGIELKLVHGHDLGLIKVDEGQMEQVLINLAVNARDAMDGSGELTVITENFDNTEPLELISEILPAGSWVVIRVKDTGCGIPPENLRRIFEPFFTTKGVGQGTGLGLATVYGIIRQTDGYLDVVSALNEGATFTLYLPRTLENQKTEEDEEKITQAEDKNLDLTGSERILLVEDEDAVRTFSQRALTNKGYQVLAASGGEQALSLLEEQKQDFKLDLLITDVVMPNMDGPTLAQRLRQHSPSLKIIFISGYTEDKLKDYMGPNIYFLPKPFTLKQLSEKVREVLGA